MLGLLFVDFIDELGSGIPVSDTPSIRTELDFGYGEVSWFLLVAPLVVSMVLEPPLMLLSDRWPRRWMVSAGLSVMAASLVLAGLASSPWVLAAALASWATAGGLGVGVAQAALMAAHPDQRERMMTRWTLMGTLGDAATPLLVGAVASAGGNWRAAMLLAAGLHAVMAAAVALGPFPAPGTSADQRHDEDDDGDDDAVSLWSRLRQGLGNRALLVWLGAAALCALLDEILLAFGTLFMRDELGATLFEQTAMLFADAVGCGVGLVLTDRLLHRVSAHRLLVGSGTLCALAYTGWLCSTAPHVAIVLMFFVGLFCAPLYPLTQARAYAACPEHPGVVRAVDTIYAPLPVLAPLALGWLADHVSLVAALSLLLLQPIGITTVALRDDPRA